MRQHIDQRRQLRSDIVESFAEIACADGHEANTLMAMYPDYRQSLDNLESPFWSGLAMDMLIACRQAEELVLSSSAKIH